MSCLSPFFQKVGGGGGDGPGGWWIGTEIHVDYPGRPNGFLHDLAGWRRDRHTQKPTGKKITAKPDWVCEILSSNRSNDLVRKTRVLHEHRVEHYWTLDLRDEILNVMRWVEGGYVTVLQAQKGERHRLEPFGDLEFSISRLMGEDE